MLIAIKSWNSDFINYIMEKYNYVFLYTDNDENNDDDDDNKDSDENDSDDDNNSDENDSDDDNKDSDNVDIDNDIKEISNDNNIIENNNDNDKKEFNNDNIDENKTNTTSRNENLNILESKQSKKDKIKHHHTKRNSKFYDVNAVLRVLAQSINSLNMMFLNSILIPFFKNEDALIVNLPNDILSLTVQDFSSFCTDLFINFPRIQKLRPITSDTISKIIMKSIEFNNGITTEKLLNNEKAADLNVNDLVIVACGSLSSIKIVKILTQHKSFDINYLLPTENLTAVHICLMSGNYHALKYLIETFPNFNNTDFANAIYYCFIDKHLLTLKYFIKYLKRKLSEIEFLQMQIDYIKYYKSNIDNTKLILDIINFIENVQI